MKHNREQVIAWIGLSEGGYVNNPHDNGGATNKGITQKTYNAWRKNKGQAQRSVLHITKAEADTIVYEEYMRPVRFDELFDGLDYALADFAVNSGVKRAVKELQTALGVTADGILGVKTLAALPRAKAARAALLDALADRRLAFVKRLSDWKHFGKGWTARFEGGRLGTQLDDIGVRDRARLLLSRTTDAQPAVVIPPPAPVGPPKAVETAQGGVISKLLAWLFGQR